jgi:hypothetical protein
MSFNLGENARGTGGNGGTGYNQRGNGGYDNFETYQRIRLKLDAVASEALSGTVYFEIGNSIWGNRAQGAALGADQTGVIELKNAYLDWTPPNTDLKIRMGVQTLALPSFTQDSQVFNDDIAAVTFSYKFNDNVSLTALWARPFNDNSLGWGAATTGGRGASANYMDNVDVGALILPLTFDGVKVSPWIMAGAIGPNFAAPTDTNQFAAVPSNAGSTRDYLLAGMLPVGRAIRKDGSASTIRHYSYATAIWAGLTGEVTAFDPFRFAWDVNYGSVSWPDDARMNRAGWLASLLFEYKLDWGIPGLYAWYASGDDDNPSNGSERMPSFSPNGQNGYSSYAFNGQLYQGEREGVISGEMTGTWGIGARLKDVTFVEDLKHTLRINYIGGTNSSTFAKRYLTNDRSDWNTGNTGFNAGYGVGLPGMYLTNTDSAVEFGLYNEYKVYDNLKVCLEASYMLLNIDEDTWKGASFNGGTGKNKREVRDPWNVNLSFVYSF